jgi:hypothetical protein
MSRVVDRIKRARTRRKGKVYRLMLLERSGSAKPLGVVARGGTKSWRIAAEAQAQKAWQAEQVAAAAAGAEGTAVSCCGPEPDSESGSATRPPLPDESDRGDAHSPTRSEPDQDHEPSSGAACGTESDGG